VAAALAVVSTVEDDLSSGAEAMFGPIFKARQPSLYLPLITRTNQMNKQPQEIRNHRASAAKVPRVLLAVAVVATIAGCAGGIQEDPSGANAVTVKPGQTANCATSPCDISLVMPAGSGSYEVTGNSVTIGTYPAGETVNLGNYFNSQALEIVGADVPKAYVYIDQL
jgi:hypothetical protein